MEETVFIAICIAILVFLCGIAIVATSKKEEPITPIQTDDISQVSQETTYENIEQEREKERIIAFLEYELPCHKRILNESLDIIERTNNLFTLLSRYNDVVEQCEWAEEKRKDGYPVSIDFGSDKNYLSSLNRVSNENILRIAINLCRVAFDKSWEAKTLKGKQNRLASCFEDIERCKTELKEHPKKQYVVAALDDLYSQVEENISNILRNEPLKTFHCKEIQEYEPKECNVQAQIGVEKSEEWDPLFREAAVLVVSTQQGSTSMLQRYFNLGYNRAGCIMDQLEAAGIVSAFDGLKKREVKIKDLETLGNILSTIE